MAPVGWGAALGYLGLKLHPLAPLVEVQLFESADLPAYWTPLDAFEGEGYRRSVARIATADGEVAARNYEIVPEHRGTWDMEGLIA